ncbi:MAG: hypothetical protein JJE52_13940 [Acidimicrobiia bacterium]|nr:hypothetical protein [Acidimicrobiia bacterium]
MTIQKLTTTNAFLAIDLPGSPSSAGVVRAAPKVLQGGAIAMARTATYTFAVRELKVGGMSAGISAEPDERDATIAAFVAEVAPRVEAGELVIDAAKGVPADALADLDAHDPRSPLHREQVDGRSLDEHLLGLGAVVAAEAAFGSLDGRRAAVEAGPAAASVTAALAARGLTDVVDDLSADVDIVFCGSRQAMIDGAAAETLAAKVLVPTGAHALSAKGLAVLHRRGIVALPDFVTTAGPTFAGWPGSATTVEAVIADAEATIAAIIAEANAHEEGPVLAACYRAEAFLSTWQETLPFGRPLA